MSEPFLGEIRMFAFDFPPKGWAACDGQVMAVGQNTALFSLLGTLYGGNGQTTFALPNLRGRVPLHAGAWPNGSFAVPLGGTGGEESHTLTPDQLGPHTHTPQGSLAPVDQEGALGNYFAATNLYTQAVPPGNLASEAIGLAGNDNPHENRQPFLAVQFCIALAGVFPSRN